MKKLISTYGPSLLLSKNVAPPRSLSADSLRNSENYTEMAPGSLATQGGNTEAHPDGIQLECKIVVDLIKGALVGKFHNSFALRLADSGYYLPTREEFRHLIAASQQERDSMQARRTWIAERYDCDDFAYVLKAFTSAVAYVNDDLVYGLACGLIWGNFKWVAEFHACNWILTSDRALQLIEPQTGSLYPASACTGNVTFLAA